MSSEDDHLSSTVFSYDRSLQHKASAPSVSRSAGSDRFQESVHLIPTQPQYQKSSFKSYLTGLRKKGRPKRYDPFIMKLPIILGTPVLILLMGLALEAGIIVSERQGGFRVPIDNKLGFIGSTQFLLSVAPLPLLVPNAILYRELDWMVRWYQPYISLSNGHAAAEETLLLDYVAIGPFFGIFYAMKYKHRIVLLSCITALATYLLQPLGSAIFAVSTAQYTEDSSVTSTKSIGLAPDFNDLSSFVAAAGFSDAAVVHKLPDPPFVKDGWATAEFTFPPNSLLNGSMVVNTTGVQTIPNCERPSQKPSIQSLGDGSFTITATSSKGCPANATFNPSDAVSQYGVVAAPCGDNANKKVDFQPVMFWFFHQRSDTGENQPDAIFCSPTINAFRVHATANLNNAALANCEKIADFEDKNNNVTGSPMSGDAFNGVLFDETNMNPFVKARSSATKTGVSGAIFKAAVQLPNGPQSTFDLPNGFLDLTTKVYRQHLAVSAKSIYFVSQNTTIPSTQESYAPRLFINPVPGHILALLLFFIGLFGLIVHVSSRRMRRGLSLGSPPGTIAHTVALTAHSGFGELLYPYDTAEEITEKLRGLKFTLDKRTGAIVADEDLAEIDDSYPLSSSITPGKDWPPETPARFRNETNVAVSKDDVFSSSAEAFHSASKAGRQTYRTPYE